MLTLKVNGEEQFKMQMTLQSHDLFSDPVSLQVVWVMDTKSNHIFTLFTSYFPTIM